MKKSTLNRVRAVACAIAFGLAVPLTALAHPTDTAVDSGWVIGKVAKLEVQVDGNIVVNLQTSDGVSINVCTQNNSHSNYIHPESAGKSMMLDALISAQIMHRNVSVARKYESSRCYIKRIVLL